MITSLFSDITCGEGCWTAKEDICKCSCNGKNHGCLKSEKDNNIQPLRTSKINGFRYELYAIDKYNDLQNIVDKVNRNKFYKIDTYTDKEGKTHEYKYFYNDNVKNALIRIKPASKIQIQNWTELNQYKNMNRFDLYKNKPYLLWLRIDKKDEILTILNKEE